MLTAILAIDKENGIGYNNNLPWKIKEDMKHFRETTINNIVIMGKNTWLSINETPLKDRVNIVISKTLKKKKENDKKINENNDVLYFNDIYECLEELKKKIYKNKQKFIIGGKYLYEYCFSLKLINTILLTKINKSYKCDKYVNIDKYLTDFYLIKKIKHVETSKYKFDILYYGNNNKEENKFNAIIKKILSCGEMKNNRTNVPCLSIFGEELHFSLENNTFPLLTTRRLPLRHIFEELMWNIRGQTDSKILEKKKIFIWKSNTTKDFLKKRKLEHYKEGDIGYTYGFLMRHYGGKYKGCEYKYDENYGYDQLKYVIDKLKNNKNDRRIILNLWDCSRMHEMTLPPCSFNYQFYVKNGKYLICKLTQRSSDICLAGGWNIAYASLMTYLLANYCDLNPHKLIFSLGDIHIYENQIENAKILMKREPNIYPKLFIKNKRKKIEDYEYSDIQLLNYNPHDKLKFQMNA